jgi:hypothetical protein
VGFLAWNLTGFFDGARRAEIGFACAAVVLCGLLYLLYRRPQVRSVEVIAPGSPAEIEVLAAAEELA